MATVQEASLGRNLALSRETVASRDLSNMNDLPKTYPFGLRQLAMPFNISMKIRPGCFVFIFHGFLVTEVAGGICIDTL